MESNIPCVLVASKLDLPEVKQFHGMTPAEFCYKHRLPPPLPFSNVFLDSTNKTIYTKLAWAAMYPYVLLLQTTDLDNVMICHRETLNYQNVNRDVGLLDICCAFGSNCTFFV